MGRFVFVIDEADLRDIMVEDYAIVQCLPKVLGALQMLVSLYARQNGVAGDGIGQGRRGDARLRRKNDGAAYTQHSRPNVRRMRSIAAPHVEFG